MAEEPRAEALDPKMVADVEAEKSLPHTPNLESSYSPSSSLEKSVEVKDSVTETVTAPDSAADHSKESVSGEEKRRSDVAAAVPGNSSESPPVVSVAVDGVRIPLVAVPCFIAPAAFLEASGFSNHFAITHQAVLATVTAQAQMNLQSGNVRQPAASPMPEKPSEENIISLEACREHVSDPKTVSPLTGTAKTPIDGFNWRKYGQKLVKGTENARSYYRCTHASCTAKKKVEHRQDGHVVEVVYRGGHSHNPPQKARFSKEKSPLSIVLSGDYEIATPVSVKSPEGAEPSPVKSDQPNLQGNGYEKRLHCSSDCEADGNVKGRGNLGEEPDLKRRSVETPNASPNPVAIVIKTAKEPKVIRHLTSDPGSLSDGYRWRKYGQKFVKGNPNPRSYYRCTQVGCPARKHVEKDSTDDGAVIINYEGKHNHDLPPPRNAAVANISNCPPPAADLLMAAAAAIEAGNHAGATTTEPPAELTTDSSLESAQTLLSIGGARPLFEDPRPAVSVHNS